MIVVYVIPYISIAAIIIMSVAVGYVALEVILRYIVPISVVIWLPIMWNAWSKWKDKTIDDEEKISCVVFPLLQVPTYAALIQEIVLIVEGFGQDLFRAIINVVGAFLAFPVLLAIDMGAAWVLLWLYKKVIRSKWITILLAVVVAILATWLFCGKGW